MIPNTRANIKGSWLTTLLKKYSAPAVRGLGRRSQQQQRRQKLLPTNTPCDIPNQQIFNHLLALERKRSERTGDLFVLMLLDFTEFDGPLGQQIIGQVCGTISAGARGTDVIGWYESPAIVGILYTALRQRNREDIRLTLLQKTTQALREHITAEDLGKVGISLHFYPEDYDKGQSAFKADDLLYPDLKSRDKTRGSYHIIKRLIDIGGALFGIILFSPLFLLAAVLIKASSEGPVLFRQRRIGKYGKEFVFLKFRTMYVNNNPEIHQQYVAKLIQQGAAALTSDRKRPEQTFKIVNDPRVTPFGKLLRRSSLDELPQFLNVLKGEMSIVGPRPPIPYEFASYSYWHRRRIVEAKPGITGLWQVAGRSRTTFDEMVRLDLKYVREQSILLDLKIICQTPAALISGHGAY